MTVLQRYNGMDTIATMALWQDFKPRLASDPATARQYDITMKLYAPALYAMIRGILVDQDTMSALRVQFEAENKALEAKLDVITRGLGMGVINLASPQQKMWMLECLGAKLPMKYDPKIGKSRPSTDRDSLEKLSKSDPELSPICNIIMAWQNRAKMLTVLQPSLLDRDGRMRTGYKVASTVTDRWSSGKNCLWTGMNMQNVKSDEKEEEVGHASIKSMFVADPGYKFINIDLKGADSWAVGLEVFLYTGDKSFLTGLQSGDVHTFVSQLTWPELPWTDNPKANKKLAEQPFYRHLSRRFMSKKAGHGSNYLGTPAALAMQMKIQRHVAENFQIKYFKAFPGIPKWHALTIAELEQNGFLTNLYGRKRNFHKRLDDNKTHKEAIAWKGQSVTSRTINECLLRTFACSLQMPWLDMQFLGQVHDSELLQFLSDPATEAEVIDVISSAMSIPITVKSRATGEVITLSIPIEISTGWNWAKESPANPDGLREYTGTIDDRKRTKTPKIPKPRFMDRRVCGVY